MNDTWTLRAAGRASLTLHATGLGVAVTHWGADLGDAPIDDRIAVPAVPHSEFDVPVRPTVPTLPSSGWLGRVGVRVAREHEVLLRLQDPRVETDGSTLRLTQRDPLAEVDVTHEFALAPSGVLAVHVEVRNLGATSLHIVAAEAALPARGDESLDLTGRWCRERHPQRRPISQGTWVRTSRHGRTGHDASLLTLVGTSGFTDRTGEVWGVHLAWSGDQEVAVDATAEGTVMLAAGELVRPGEVTLERDGSYRSPAALFAYAHDGIDGVTRQFHAWFRARPTHPARPRPVVLNTWEAVYFDHDLDTLRELADVAAEIGVERFVLDDGWFLGRRDDRRGLGDWSVDPAVWPDGLAPLIDEVRSRGMEFGLWVEPEMVNLDSELVRAHPDWVSGPVGRRTLPWRQQYLLDIANPDAWQYLFDALDALLRDHDIAFLKWDHNRDEPEAQHGDVAGARAQTLAAYRLLDALREAHPGVEIESCASGGGRVDAGILQRTDRVWASDCNDALERITIQRWTESVLPPELIGAHVGPPESHTTGRTHDIAFRAAVALGGHFGIEWDVREATPAQRAELAATIALYRAERALLHGGTVVHDEQGEGTLVVRTVVATDAGRAITSVLRTASSPAEHDASILVRGLDPESTYRIERVLPVPGTDADEGAWQQRATPAWLAAVDRGETVEATGAVLAHVGLTPPVIRPERGIVLRFTRVD